MVVCLSRTRLPFPDTCSREQDGYIYYVLDMIIVWDTAVSIIIHLPWMFLPTNILS